jgi:hypothetical protein
MLESNIAGSPVLALAVAVLAGIFVLLVVGAAVSNWHDRRRVAAAAAEERVAPAAYAYPAVDALPAYQAAHPEYHVDSMPPAAEPAPRRRGFGLAALSIAFVLGGVAGVVVMATARDEIADGLARLAALVGSEGPVTPPPVATGGGSPVLAPGTPPVPTAPGPEVTARLAAFATSLEQTLPRPAGPELSLTRVSVEGTTLHLGYDVGRVVPPDEVDDFKAYIDRTVRSLFCAREAGEVRYLSENGVAFHMSYVDPSGITVTELTVTPEFCV